MRLNNTPIRTSKNFNINDIEIKDKNVLKMIDNYQKSANAEMLFSIKQMDNITNSYSDEENKEENIQKQEKEKLLEDFSLKYGTNIFLKPNYITKITSSKTLEIEIDGILAHNILIEANDYETLDVRIIFTTKNTKGIIKEKEIEENKEEEKGIKEDNKLNYGIIKTKAKKSSNIKLTIINLTNIDTTNIISIQNELEENSYLDLNIVEFGGKYIISNIYSILSNYSKCNLNSIYFGTQDQIIDLNYIADLKGIESKIDINVNGALDKNAKKHFKGTINFLKGAKKSIGSETENCIMLSNEAQASSLPILLCTEEDVSGNHSTSSGKVQLDKLFYLMSRGFSKNEALKLLIKARFSNVLNNISYDRFLVCEKVLDEKLNLD